MDNLKFRKNIEVNVKYAIEQDSQFKHFNDIDVSGVTKEALKKTIQYRKEEFPKDIIIESMKKSLVNYSVSVNYYPNNNKILQLALCEYLINNDI